MVRWRSQTSKLSGRTILQLSKDLYHTEFASWHVDNILFVIIFSHKGGWVVGVWTLMEHSLFSTRPLVVVVVNTVVVCSCVVNKCFSDAPGGNC